MTTVGIGGVLTRVAGADSARSSRKPSTMQTLAGVITRGGIEPRPARRR